MKKFLKWLFTMKDASSPRAPNPPRPKNWDKTIGDLMQELSEGRRKSIGQPELDWAREYTRSLLPDGLRYPMKADVYEALSTQCIRYVTHWRKPFTGGHKTMIHSGERVWIHEPSHERPISVHATPINYNLLEQRIVPAEDRLQPDYDGFSLSIDTMILLNNFRLVEMNAPQPGSEEINAPRQN